MLELNQPNIKILAKVLVNIYIEGIRPTRDNQESRMKNCTWRDSENFTENKYILVKI